MQKQIIMPTPLNPELISLLSRPYEVLTDEFIQRWLYQLYCDHLIDPEYLFTNQKGRRDLRTVIESMQGYWRFWATGLAVDDILSRYINQSTGTVMHIVVLPTLPDNLLLVGNLVIHTTKEL